jgi:hypothetical protein
MPLAETTVSMAPAASGGIAETAQGVAGPAPAKAPATTRWPTIAAVGVAAFVALLGGSLVAVVAGRHERAVDGAATTKSALTSVVPPTVPPEPVASASANSTERVAEEPPTIRVEDLPSIVSPIETPARPPPQRPHAAPSSGSNPYTEPAAVKSRPPAAPSAGSASATPPASAMSPKKKWKVECL